MEEDSSFLLFIYIYIALSIIILYAYHVLTGFLPDEHPINIKPSNIRKIQECFFFFFFLAILFVRVSKWVYVSNALLESNTQVFSIEIPRISATSIQSMMQKLYIYKPIFSSFYAGRPTPENYVRERSKNSLPTTYYVEYGTTGTANLT